MTDSQQGGTGLARARRSWPSPASTRDRSGSAGLTAGGCALLVFVSQECPTSALALRNLGPLCRAWQQAGLTCTAVFEDPLEVAIRVARRLRLDRPGGRRRQPPYETSRAYRLCLGADDGPGRPGRDAGRAPVVGWDQPALPR